MPIRKKKDETSEATAPKPAPKAPTWMAPVAFTVSLTRTGGAVVFDAGPVPQEKIDLLREEQLAGLVESGTLVKEG